MTSLLWSPRPPLLPGGDRTSGSPVIVKTKRVSPMQMENRLTVKQRMEQQEHAGGEEDWDTNEESSWIVGKWVRAFAGGAEGGRDVSVGTVKERMQMEREEKKDGHGDYGMETEGSSSMVGRLARALSGGAEVTRNQEMQLVQEERGEGRCENDTIILSTSIAGRLARALTGGGGAESVNHDVQMEQKEQKDGMHAGNDYRKTTGTKGSVAGKWARALTGGAESDTTDRSRRGDQGNVIANENGRMADTKGFSSIWGSWTRKFTGGADVDARDWNVDSGNLDALPAICNGREGKILIENGRSSKSLIVARFARSLSEKTATNGELTALPSIGQGRTDMTGQVLASAYANNTETTPIATRLASRSHAQPEYNNKLSTWSNAAEDINYHSTITPTRFRFKKNLGVICGLLVMICLIVGIVMASKRTATTNSAANGDADFQGAGPDQAFVRLAPTSSAINGADKSSWFALYGGGLFQGLNDESCPTSRSWKSNPCECMETSPLLVRSHNETVYYTRLVSVECDSEGYILQITVQNSNERGGFIISRALNNMARLRWLSVKFDSELSVDLTGDGLWKRDGAECASINRCDSGQAQCIFAPVVPSCVRDTAFGGWLVLFASTHGVDWRDCSSLKLDPCACSNRVTCEYDASGHPTGISRLDLVGNNLRGSLPPGALLVRAFGLKQLILRTSKNDLLARGGDYTQFACADLPCTTSWACDLGVNVELCSQRFVTHPPDQAAFALIRKSTNGANWLECKSSNDACNDCSNRVVCAVDRIVDPVALRILKLNLAGNGLNGSFPSYISNGDQFGSESSELSAKGDSYESGEALDKLIAVDVSGNFLKNTECVAFSPCKSSMDFLCVPFDLFCRNSVVSSSSSSSIVSGSDSFALHSDDLMAWQECYDLLNGPKWINCSAFRNDPCGCGMPFVRCVADSARLRITEIRLPDNGLRGSAFPSQWFERVTSLLVLDVHSSEATARATAAGAATTNSFTPTEACWLIPRCAMSAAQCSFENTGARVCKGFSATSSVYATLASSLVLRSVDLFAWEDLYGSLNGGFWLVCWDSINDPCGTCPGVLCQDVNGEYSIVGIKLPNNNAVGYFPVDSVNAMTNLKWLDLGNINDCIGNDGPNFPNSWNSDRPCLDIGICFASPVDSECNLGAVVGTQLCATVPPTSMPPTMPPTRIPTTRPTTKSPTGTGSARPTPHSPTATKNPTTTAPTSAAPTSAAPTSDGLKVSDALAWGQIYDALDGASWKVCRNSRNDPCGLASNNGCDADTKIVCNSESGTLRIVKVLLPNNGMVGLFPSQEFNQLDALTVLTVFNTMGDEAWLNVFDPKTGCALVNRCFVNSVTCDFENSGISLCFQDSTFSPTLFQLSIPSELAAWQAFYDSASGDDWITCGGPRARNNPCDTSICNRGTILTVNVLCGLVGSQIRLLRIQLPDNHLRGSLDGPAIKRINELVEFDISSYNFNPEADVFNLFFNINGCTAQPCCLDLPRCYTEFMSCLLSNELNPIPLCPDVTTPSPVTPTLPTTAGPSLAPTTRVPSLFPSLFPSTQPTLEPSQSPTLQPTEFPTTKTPSNSPIQVGTNTPTRGPSRLPTFMPSLAGATLSPTTLRPTFTPTTIQPTTGTPISTSPTILPTRLPTTRPSNWFTLQPSKSPSVHKSLPPSRLPSQSPTRVTKFPSRRPTSQSPTQSPIFVQPNALDLESWKRIYDALGGAKWTVCQGSRSYPCTCRNNVKLAFVTCGPSTAAAGLQGGGVGETGRRLQVVSNADTDSISIIAISLPNSNLNGTLPVTYVEQLKSLKQLNMDGNPLMDLPTGVSCSSLEVCSAPGSSCQLGTACNTKTFAPSLSPTAVAASKSVTNVAATAVGAVFGVLLGLLLIVFLVWYCCYRKPEKDESRSLALLAAKAPDMDDEEDERIRRLILQSSQKRLLSPDEFRPDGHSRFSGLRVEAAPALQDNPSLSSAKLSAMKLDDAARKDVPDMDHLLENIGLGHLSDILKRNGIDDATKLMRMKEDKMKEMGFVVGERVKLKRALDIRGGKKDTIFEEDKGVMF